MRSIVVCPDLGLADRLIDALAHHGGVEVVRTIGGYPSATELIRVMRSVAPDLIFLSFYSVERANGVVDFLNREVSGLQIIAIHKDLDANVLRDSLLHLAGTLDLTLGGPTIDPKREDSVRRSFYFTQSPEDLNKFLEMFDNANTKECYRRDESILPQQALALANSRLVNTAAAKVAERLNAARPHNLPPLNVCIQVNVSGEDSKSGVAPGDEMALARAIAALPRLRLRGLMAIPEPTDDVALMRQRFRLLGQLLEGLAAAGYDVDTLSMGMSDDLEWAIREGATWVRIGTALFGPRRP